MKERRGREGRKKEKNGHEKLASFSERKRKEKRKKNLRHQKPKFKLQSSLKSKKCMVTYAKETFPMN